MKRLDEPVADILSELGEAAVNQDWDRAETELDLLSEEIVEALIERRDDDIRQMAIDVERLYARQAAGLEDGTPLRQAMVTGQMRTLAGLLVVAQRHRRAPDSATLMDDTANSLILKALYHGERSSRDLAKEIGYREETVARKLPLLRAAGLVASRKCGRAMMNALSETGKRAIEAVRYGGRGGKARRQGVDTAQLVFGYGVGEVPDLLFGDTAKTRLAQHFAGEIPLERVSLATRAAKGG